MKGLYSKTIIAAGVVLTLSGCGGGSSDSDSGAGATTLSGVFTDSPVKGLNYSCAPSGLSGVTTAGGIYEYEDGDSCTFSIGDVEIGSAVADGVVSPIDLVSDSSPTDPTVVNIVQLLMMLDDDGDPSNGIELDGSSSTGADFSAAVGGGTVDFSSATFDVDMDDVESSLGRTLPSDSDAEDHLTSSLSCALSGAFTGTFSGDIAGNWGVVIDPESLEVYGAYSTHTSSFLMDGFGSPDNLLVLGGSNSFVSEGIDGEVFTGSLTDFNSASGSWAGDADAGDFSGSRVDVSSIETPVYRVVGQCWGDFEVGIYSVEIDSSNNVEGTLYNPWDGELWNVTGTYNPGTDVLSFEYIGGFSGSVTFDPDTGDADGTWADEGVVGTIRGHGCTL
ncbi:hypothetical protein [Solemya pervernicosa gill symbiont]|uniref:hypothetical protein n=1 Tax=Solemya pervernicosa gill symbiont TaxID=642797 RepID=UPI0010828198|nr:hypothetical protein [Solemya pervernicosa gill symbiont]